MKPSEVKLIEGFFYWVKWQSNSKWEICKHQEGKFHYTDGGQIDVSSAFEIDFVPNKESYNNHFNWLITRRDESKKEYDAVGTSTPNELTEKASKGGKLRAFKEIIAFMQTH